MLLLHLLRGSLLLYPGSRDGTETLSVAFTSSEKRASWEESFIETKLKLRGIYPTNNADRTRTDYKVMLRMTQQCRRIAVLLPSSSLLYPSGKPEPGSNSPAPLRLWSGTLNTFGTCGSATVTAMSDKFASSACTRSPTWHLATGSAMLGSLA